MRNLKDRHLQTYIKSITGYLTRRQFIKMTGSFLGSLGLLNIRTRNASADISEDVLAEIISVNPERPHLVMPGAATTFVLSVSNVSAEMFHARAFVESQTTGWTATLSRANRLFQSIDSYQDSLELELPGSSLQYCIIRFHPQQGMPENSLGSAKVSVSVGNETICETSISAKVRNQPKIYMLAYDGLPRNYMKLDRSGGYQYVKTNPLMPNFRKFAAESALLLKGRSQVPSFTDANHTAALTGSWPGTTGTIGVKSYYGGRDGNGDQVIIPAKHDILRWGSSGEPVLSIFDVAKDPEMGGDTDALNAYITGKDWMTKYFEDGNSTVDILANGANYPYYITPPEKYRLGDPPTDVDAGTDRDGINVRPLRWFHAIMDPILGTNYGKNPDAHPQDRWIIESALQIIAAEDPEVFYISPGLVDAVGHHVGGADRPEEWAAGFKPGAQWDDINVYNINANRGPALDMVHEADATLGMFLDVLNQNETSDNSIVSLLSDHGMHVYMHQYLDVMQILLDNNVPEEAIDCYICRGEVFQIFFTDRDYIGLVTSILEDYRILHPVFNRELCPFVVLDKSEMETGEDGVLGRVAQSSGPRRAELYSEWYIDNPVGDNTKPLWPDIMGFTAYRYQGVYTGFGRKMNGGHGGFGEVQDVPLILRGPGIKSGVYQNNAYLVDIVPTLYSLLGWETPDNVDGRILDEIIDS